MTGRSHSSLQWKERGGGGGIWFREDINNFSRAFLSENSKVHTIARYVRHGALIMFTLLEGVVGQLTCTSIDGWCGQIYLGEAER